MYLKSVELIGFKSFASKTELRFKPGLMAIVGPNGCGKSNICEAIRWVLGEKSAKALRGKKMEDVIFSGADGRRPLGMAEVSITFGACEDVLNSEFNEITISRRVFRSGENQYFINRTHCRLKDIQRLFMDTGIGTVSYSLLEQGHIDRILSSRPEDRRGIFEEASGINKFKTDRAEAIRKLEHTEANLLRLDDIIREVKRQIGSLQRQAGKARRYKVLQDELRSLDLHLIQHTLREMNERLGTLDNDKATLEQQLAAHQEQIGNLEQEAGQCQSLLGEADNKIAETIQLAAERKAQLQRNHDLITSNQERLHEFESIVTRDKVDIERAASNAESLEQSVIRLREQVSQLEQEKAEADTELSDQTQALAACENKINARRERREALRGSLMDVEGEASRLQNDRLRMESELGAATIRLERLSAEQSQLARMLEEHEARENEAGQSLAAFRSELADAEAKLKQVSQRDQEAQQQVEETLQSTRDLESRRTVVLAKLDLLRNDGSESALPNGTQVALKPDNPLQLNTPGILGTLAELITIDAEYQQALETALRSVLDAIVVADEKTALQTLQAIAAGDHGSTRILHAGAPPRGPAPAAGDPGVGTPLMQHIVCDNTVQPLVNRLLGDVFVVPSLDTLPRPAPPNLTFVTRDGSLVRGAYAYEHWSTARENDNPLSRKHLSQSLDSSLAELETQLESRAAELRKGEEHAAESTAGYERLVADIHEHQLALAAREAEFKVLSKATAQARERLETVSWEIKNTDENDSTGRNEIETLSDRQEELRTRSDAIQTELDEVTLELHDMESKQSGLYSALMERKVRSTTLEQTLGHVSTKRAELNDRIVELKSTITDQTDGLERYQSNMVSLRAQAQTAEEEIPKLEQTVKQATDDLSAARSLRESRAGDARGIEEAISNRRDDLDQLRESRSDIVVKLTESNMRRLNLLERASADYSVDFDGIMAHPEPETAEDLETLDTRIAELRTKLDAMGPVNLVAIAEYQELQERVEFLSKQREDLVNAKRQLVDMINRINETTAELFTSTFEKINENFQEVFAKLFGGGTAKLVLTNEEDVLECGVEIIARPPGKKLQNVSLLSGGERTMTAVALLFSIYMIKPSPFCVLDELDAALDESNIKRFIEILRGFIKQSQFIVVTHNQRTIAAADVLYGVTMVKNTGTSKIVSMEFKDAPTANQTPDLPSHAVRPGISSVEPVAGSTE